MLAPLSRPPHTSAAPRYKQRQTTTQVDSLEDSAMDASSSAQRKIELQSPEDFSYLVDNVRRAAADSINAAFPPVDGSDPREDELRVEVERMVNDYITQTFTLAAPNVTINGLPFDPAPYLATDDPDPQPLHPFPAAANNNNNTSAPQYEPFDGRKRQRVEELAREEEDLLREIAALKRRVPGATAGAWAGAARARLAEDEAALEAARAGVVAMAAAAGGGKKSARGDGDGDGDGSGGAERKRKGPTMLGDESGGPLERQEVVEGAFAGAVEGLERLQREMPAAVARMERARQAGEYVLTAR